MPTDVTALTAALLQQTPLVCDAAAHLREAEIAATAPKDTGALADSSQVDTQPNGDGAVSTITFDTEYASYLDEGTGPHQIDGNPLLAFEWGGQTVIVHSVQHPGSTKHVNWFTGPALDDAAWGSAVQDALDGIPIA